MTQRKKKRKVAERKNFTKIKLVLIWLFHLIADLIRTWKYSILRDTSETPIQRDLFGKAQSRYSIGPSSRRDEMSILGSRISKRRISYIEKVGFTVLLKSTQIAVFGSVGKKIYSTATCLGKHLGCRKAINLMNFSKIHHYESNQKISSVTL